MSPPSSYSLPGSSSGRQCLRPSSLACALPSFLIAALRRAGVRRRLSRTRSPNSPTTNFPIPKRPSARLPPPAIRSPFPSSARFRTAGCWPIPTPRRSTSTRHDGKVIDAATGAAVDKLPDNAAAVRLNNRLRRIVEAALGGLTLLSPDPATRIAAAQSVFKIARRGDAAGDRRRAEEGNQQGREDGLHRSPRRNPAVQVRRHRCRQARRHRRDQGARRPGSAGDADRPPPTSRRPSRVPRPAATSVRSRARSRSGRRCRTPGTACRSARCCCSRRSVLRSPSA